MLQVFMTIQGFRFDVAVKKLFKAHGNNKQKAFELGNNFYTQPKAEQLLDLFLIWFCSENIWLVQMIQSSKENQYLY